jgi:hypothetical protein
MSPRDYPVSKLLCDGIKSNEFILTNIDGFVMSLNYKRIIYNLISLDNSRAPSTADLKMAKKPPVKKEIKKEIKKGGDKKGLTANKNNCIANVAEIVELAVIKCPFPSALIGQVFNY